MSFDTPINLDSSILNTSDFAGTNANRSISRGKRVGFRKRVLPFYGYYGADGEMVMASEQIMPVEQSIAPQQSTVEYVPTEMVVSQVAPNDTVNYAAPTEMVQSSPTYVPNETVGQVFVDPNYVQYVPIQQQEAPIVQAPESAPIVQAPESAPIVVAQYTQPTTTQQATAQTQPTTQPTVAKPTTGGSTMPMGGGGGGGVAPASKPATTTTTKTETIKTPNGTVTQKTETVIEHKGMSTGMKVGIAAVLLVGGYFAWKNKAKLGF